MTGLRLLLLTVAGCLLVACGRSESPADVVLVPPAETTASWSADTLLTGAHAVLTVEITAGVAGVKAGAELRVGFPHWVYGSRDVRPPKGAEKGAYGHWYVVRTLEEPLAAGEVVRWELPSMRLPQTFGGFAPLVFLDWELLPGIEDQSLEPGPPKGLAVVAPSWVEPGAPMLVGSRLEDAHGNPIAAQRNSGVAPTEPGVVSLPMQMEHEGSWTGTSQPVLVAPLEPGIERIAWLDPHGHSGLSDGRGAPDGWFFAAVGWQFLDGVALSDHDWQLTDAEWGQLLTVTEQANEPGLFVTLPAVETNVHGHEIAYFADAQRLAALPSKGSRDGARTIWEETDRGQPTAKVPDVLGMYTQARSEGASGADLLVATHTSLAAHMGTGFPLASPLPANQAYEIYSAHGSSECDSCPRRVEGGDLEPGEAVGSLWDALDAGMDFTLIAASDAHDGRPATRNWGAWPGGLTAVEVPELTRGAVFEAIAAGNAWATTGERTLLRVRWHADSVQVLVVGRDIEAVEVVGDRSVVARRDAPLLGEWFTLDGLPANAWRYVRVLLPDGGRAWRGVWRPTSTAAGRATSVAR
ncbi:MAG: hypothetical protein KDA24_07655 [Deltaproteobacteria bacterium]|nr:hypothetical protein [Deltaproteobacteria bacterium]